MKCDLCNKKATVHLTEIVDEQMSEMHLCEECAREKSVQMEQQFGLSDLLAGLTDFGKQTQTADKIDLKCKACGITYDD
ncbi:MAG: excinuclease ABC subunit B, partial [Candidatus Omnitrophica bacterium]|nr:excinuclease ABC subunit B [Candidatus Omnitrophota bacterium]